MLFIGIVLSYSLGDKWLLIAVCTSLDNIHSSSIDGVVYCTMPLMCALPDSSPVTVVLLWLVTDGNYVALCYFLICPSV